MKRLSLSILLSCLTLIGFGQFNRPFFINIYSSKCFKIKKQFQTENKVLFSYVDSCSNTSGIFNLVVFDSTKYFRHGENVWYYDTAFKKPKVIIPFYLGVPYGLIQTFYPNGNIQSEGKCKTVRYFQPSGSKIIFKIDQKDTTVINYNGRDIYDSILSISKNSFTHPITYETQDSEEVSKYIIISFPFYQKQKIGCWKYYDRKGNLLKKEWYAMGKFIKP